MHRVTYTLRQITALPRARDEVRGVERPATSRELLGFGLVHLHDDVYECVTQERQDPDTLLWTVDVPPPGAAISVGAHEARYARVPRAFAGKVFRAQVIRSDDPLRPVTTVVAANLAEVKVALDQFVGDVGGRPLVPVTGDDAVLAEAQRLVHVPDNGIDRRAVPMAGIVAGDVVEAKNLIPHRWAGESSR